MKRTRILATLALLVAMVLVSTMVVSAQGGTWVSGIMIQNQSETDDAHVTITFYWAEGETLAGQVAATITRTIIAGQATSIYGPDITDLPDDFVGSAVVSSDQPVVANVNTQVPSGSGATEDDPNRVGTASGVLSPSTTLNFTQVMNDYYEWNSYLAVQNTSSSEASVTVRYYNDSDGSEVSAAADTQTISAYSTYIFRQPDNSSLSSSWGGSAVVTSTQALAGVANFYNSGTAKDTAQFHSYNAFGSGGTKLYAPRLVKDYYDYQSGLKIQNVGSAATDVTIVYYFGGSAYTQTVSSLQPSAATGLYLGDGSQVPELAGVSGSGSGVITSSGEPIVATVNEDNRLGQVISGHEGRGVTYNAIVDGSQSDTVLFSQVTSRFYGYSGGIQVQNVGSAGTTVTAVFSAPGFTDVTEQTTLQPNESVSWFGPDAVSAPGFNGSVVVTAGESLVGIANMSYRQDRDPGDGWAANYGDSFLTYNGVNK